ncbi:MAG: hypothetical protein OQL18_06350 [Deltaproteobacteria bacterium]|jgi:hypothetical protein|nr:hypothetical protein [Deltaproteobacteria bacterium]
MDSIDPSLNVASVKKIQHGLNAMHDELFQLILDPDPEFIRLLLKNPHVDEDHLLALLKRRDLPAELISQIHRANRQALSHRLLLALVKNPATPGTLTRTLLPHLRLFELLDLCYLPGATPDQKLAAERTILQRLPTTPLGNKITLARRGTTNIVAALLKEGQSQLFEVCLSSPRLKEAALFQFLRGATASAETISMVARHERWKQRPNLQMAILKNTRTPDIWFTLWLPKLPLTVLKQLRLSFKANPSKKRLVETEVKKRGGF